CKDLDEAATLLPVKYDDSELGRATKGAALALKSRILLYKASPLFGTPSREKWKAAADAAKAVMDLGVYSLKSVSNSEDYGALFLDPTNPEVIFEKLYDPKYGA
ncbi:MAG TPA: RagB/SusD family nutrient uptake outer membrane protein, partial [Segatella copri]|nr:RagB/SusD family nutrient uptake outer membrane protein [Segatella copri]